jgi:mannose-6-phosphate isomerase-like protein (cupin superfamily)
MIVPSDGGLRFEDGADRGRVVVSGEETGGRYALMEWTVAPAATGGEPPSYGPHTHQECEETFLIRSGTLEFLLGDQVTSLGPGDFVRVPAGVRHGYRNTSGQAVNMLVSFHPAGLERLFVKYRSDQPSPPEGDGFIADATRFHASVFET